MPTCGKTTVATLLEEEFGGVIIDDGLLLREALPVLTGIDPSLPFSQEGKATAVQVGDLSETVREGLGELGNYLEGRYGEDILPLRAMQRAAVEHPHAPFYIYPSVRKSQGRAYKRYGGIVVEVVRDGTQPSGNDFDRYDNNLVDIRVENFGTLDDLREYVLALPSLLALL